MDDKRGFVRAVGRVLVWAFLGLGCSTIIGGFLSIIVGTAIETADRSMAGLGSPFVLVVSAIFSAPGGAVAGVVGAVVRRASHRFIAAFAAGFLVALYPSLMLFRHDDTSWPYSLLILGGGPLVGTIAAGPLAAWLARSYDVNGG
jgi:hypothetical protein